ncbi:hypothetical protein [Arcanobacterium phocae]|nr:hypothetical protein [Arcanobacterium phocae]
MVLAQRGYIDLSTYFLDGTKIEANANKYSFVWSKSIARYKSKLQEKSMLTLPRSMSLTLMRISTNTN